MSKQSDIGKRIDETLESLRGVQRAELSPWFFTRVKARLERDQHNIWETAGSFMARPAIAIAGLVLILCINAFIVFEKDTLPSDPASISSNITEPVEEYVLNAANSNYDYENLEP
ncbi:MAG TPA: hypothetical protein VIZ28_12115 [Chitinophagaceae bacterium]